MGTLHDLRPAGPKTPTEIPVELIAPREKLGKTDARILIYDIERIKGTAEIEFWDLNDMKGRRINADDVTCWPQTLCAAFKWYGQKTVHFTSTWQHGKEGMALRLWQAFDKADIVIGFNHKAFDNRKVRDMWDELHMVDPSSWKDVDLLQHVRSRNGFESKKMDIVNQRLGLTGKTDKYDAELAKAAYYGNREAQRILRAYNEGDVFATEYLYDEVRHKIKNHPAVRMLPNGHAPMQCDKCGSTELKRNGKTYAEVNVYQRYRCECGAEIRARHLDATSGKWSNTRSVA